MSRAPQRKPGRGNALLGWELMRVSRRIGTLALGRFVFGAALLVVMWLLWSANYAHLNLTTGDAAQIQQQLSRFAGEFSLTFFIVQLGIVLLLTPIYVAGSVFEERETRSGEVLLTTDLTRREIFYGKFLARVVQVILVVAAGMPILALTLLWGGVSWQFILTGYAVTMISIFSAGAIAASVSSNAETLRGAILMTYGYLFFFDGLLFFVSPFAVLVLSHDSGIGGFACGMLFFVIRIIVIATSLQYGLRWLRLAMLRQRKRVHGVLAEEMRYREPLRDDEDAFWWKEKNVATNAWLLRDIVPWLAVVCVLPVMFGVLASIDGPHVGWLAEYVLPLAILLVGGMIGISTASSVANERQKNTLLDLFMVPNARRAILAAKFWGAFWRLRFVLALLLVLVFLTLANGTPLVAVPLMLLCGTLCLLLAGAYGLWLSVRCQTSWNANAAWVGGVAAVVVGGIILVEAFSPLVKNPVPSPYNPNFVTATPSWALAVHPYYTWRELSLTERVDSSVRLPNQSVIRAWPTQSVAILPAFVGLLLLGGLAWGFWSLACRRFDREGRD